MKGTIYSLKQHRGPIRFMCSVKFYNMIIVHGYDYIYMSLKWYSLTAVEYPLLKPQRALEILDLVYRVNFGRDLEQGALPNEALFFMRSFESKSSLFRSVPLVYLLLTQWMYMN